MKGLILQCVLLLMLCSSLTAQVGIGTTTPNSTLDVRGAISLNYRSFTGSTNIAANDHTIVYTGDSNAVAILPDATICPGRIYHIKNASAASVTPVLTVTCQPGQSIDGCHQWTLDDPNEAIAVLSNGLGWYISSQARSGASSGGWQLDGNSLGSEKKLGTVSNTALPFITANTERMRLTAGGRLGIGTGNPATETHIVAQGYSSNIATSYIRGITITSTGSSGFGGPGFYLENLENPAGKKLFKINFTANSGADSYVNFQAVSDNGSSNVNANVMAIMHSGRVGIGTATFNTAAPEKLLVEAGYTSSIYAMGVRGTIDNGLHSYVQNTNPGASAYSAFQAMSDNGNSSSNYLNAGINSSANTNTGVLGGANRAFLYSTGSDLAIGNAASGKDIIFFTGGTSSSNEILRITAGGMRPAVDNTVSLGQSSFRFSEVWSSNGLIQTSDARLKTDIQALPYGLRELMQLRPVVYRWKNDPSQLKVGLIAQEVQKIVPEVVIGNPSGDTLGMNYAELVPVLINAVKELKQQVDELKKQLEKK